EIMEKQGHYHFLVFQAKDRGLKAMRQGNYAEAKQYIQEIMRICKQVNDQTSLSDFLIGLASVALLEEDYPEAKGKYQAALAIAQEYGLSNYIKGDSKLGLSVLAYIQGQYALAESFEMEAED